LFFRNNDFNKSVYVKKLTNRFRTIFIPFILWNVIAVIYQFVCLIPDDYYWGIELSFVRVFNTFFSYSGNAGIFVTSQETEVSLLEGVYPINVPLWYLRNLMLMVVFSPVIYWLIRTFGKWFVISAGVVWFFVTTKEDHIDYLFTSIFFFSWGAYYGINKINFVSCFRRIKYAPLIYLIVACVDTITKGSEVNRYFHIVSILLGMISAVIVVSYLIERDKIKMNSLLTKSSFFIFALHYLIINPLGYKTFRLFNMTGDNPYAMLCFYFGVVTETVVICLVLYILLNRFMPKVCKVLCGGR